MKVTRDKHNIANQTQFSDTFVWLIARQPACTNLIMQLNSHVGVGGEWWRDPSAGETRRIESGELLKLGDEYMGLHYTLLFASYMFEIFQDKKWLIVARCYDLLL